MERSDHLNCRPVLRQLLSNAHLAIEQAAFICEVNSLRYKTAALCSISAEVKEVKELQRRVTRQGCN